MNKIPLEHDCGHLLQLLVEKFENSITNPVEHTVSSVNEFHIHFSPPPKLPSNFCWKKMPWLFQISAMNRARPRSPVWLDVFKVPWIKEQGKARYFHSCINGRNKWRKINMWKFYSNYIPHNQEAGCSNIENIYFIVS